MEALLITGFLGSGKTTFVLRSLINRYRHKRLGIVVNDFGEVSYDRLSYYQKGLEVMGVEGGCFCCETGGELLEALNRLKNVDLLIIETSGLSEPYPIMQAMETSGFSSYLVVCVVGGDSWQALKKEPIFLSQVNSSDCLVVSRCDLLIDQDIEELYSSFEKPLFLCYEGVVEEEFFSFFGGQGYKRHNTGEFKRTDKKERFSSITKRLKGYYSMEDVEDYLRKLPKEVVRVKGVIKTLESPIPMGLNWTRGHLSWEPYQKPISPFLTFISYGMALLPPMPMPRVQDWRKAMPLGEFDTRKGIAYLEGKVVDEISAIEWLLAQDLSQATVITCSNSFEPPLKGIRVNPEFQEFYNLAESLKEEKGSIMLWDVPDALASYLIENIKDKPMLHIGRYYLLPRATLSVRIDNEEKARALKDLL